MDQTRALGSVVRWEVNATTPCPTVFTRHRGRFPEADVTRAFLSGLLVRKPVIRLPSSDRCSVAAMMFEA